MSENKNVEKIDETFKQIEELENEKNLSMGSTEEDDSTDLDETPEVETPEVETPEVETPEVETPEVEEESEEVIESDDLEKLIELENYFDFDKIGVFAKTKKYKKLYEGLKVLGATNSNQVKILNILEAQFGEETIEE